MKLKFNIREEKKLFNIKKGDFQKEIKIIFDKTNLEVVNVGLKKISNYDNIVLIGIGGSNLGFLALYELFKNNLNKKVVFADSVEKDTVEKVNNFVAKNNPLIILVSKSGKTFESLYHFQRLATEFKPKGIIIITDENSPLIYLAQKNNYLYFVLNPKLTGRFSVFSPVCLVPMKLTGLNIDEFFKGAEKALKNWNKITKSAQATFTLFKKSYDVLNIFIWRRCLINLGMWYRQIIAESLGKNNSGLLPILTFGNIDLHSMIQYYFDGRKNIFTNFIDFDKDDTKEHRAIVKSIKNAYKNLNLPYSEFILDNLDEKNIGEFMMFKIMETIILGKLMKINPFDQPAVEYYKDELKKVIRNYE